MDVMPPSNGDGGAAGRALATMVCKFSGKEGGTGHDEGLCIEGCARERTNKSAGPVIDPSSAIARFFGGELNFPKVFFRRVRCT